MTILISIEVELLSVSQYDFLTFVSSAQQSLNPVPIGYASLIIRLGLFPKLFCYAQIELSNSFSWAATGANLWPAIELVPPGPFDLFQLVYCTLPSITNHRNWRHVTNRPWTDIVYFLNNVSPLSNSISDTWHKNLLFEVKVKQKTQFFNGFVIGLFTLVYTNHVRNIMDIQNQTNIEIK